MFVGVYFLGVFIYLMSAAAIPLTQTDGWRGIADVIAVEFYLLGVIPLFGISLLEFGVIGKGKDFIGKLKIHALFVTLFLIVAHIAMIFGMLNPEVQGYSAQGAVMMM